VLQQQAPARAHLRVGVLREERREQVHEGVQCDVAARLRRQDVHLVRVHDRQLHGGAHKGRRRGVAVEQPGAMQAAKERGLRSSSRRGALVLALAREAPLLEHGGHGATPGAV